MRFLLDTNVVSDVRGGRQHEPVQVAGRRVLRGRDLQGVRPGRPDRRELRIEQPVARARLVRVQLVMRDRRVQGRLQLSAKRRDG